MENKRQSIFSSALRSFFNTFAGMFGIIIGLIIIGAAIAMFAKPQMVSDKTALIIAADAEGNRSLLPVSTPVVFRLNIHGMIGSRDLNSKTIESQLLDSQEGALKGNRVKALLLHINSPGGSAFDSHEIYQKLVEYKKKYNIPIYAYIDGLCASGGMMIACSADKIFSPSVGMIGSVGVLLGPNFNFSGLMEKFGVTQLTITEGKDKDMLSPYREWQSGEDQSLKDIIAYNYNQFVDLVTSNRPRISRTKLVNEYGAQVFDPIRAEEYGYIDDGNSSYNKTLKELTKQAGLKDDESYQVIELKIIHPVLSDLIEGRSPILSGKIKHEHQIGPELYKELMNRPLYLYSPAVGWQ